MTFESIFSIVTDPSTPYFGLWCKRVGAPQNADGTRSVVQLVGEAHSGELNLESTQSYLCDRSFSQSGGSHQDAISDGSST